MKNIRFMTLLAVVFFTLATMSHAQSEKTEINIYNPVLRSGKEMGKVKTDIANMLSGKTTIYDKKNNLSGIPKDILVLDDRIEFKIKNQNTIIYFSDIIDDKILAQETNTISAKNMYISCSAQILLNNFIFSFEGPLMMRKLACNRFEELKNYADDLYFIQYQLREKRYKSQLVLFEPIAEQYRALKVKPPVSEELRKYIVQANSFNQQKMYDKAIELYNKAIELDQTAYPAACSNLALLSAQVYKFDAAIYYMKKYLLLEPDASDARSAQDKIYEWEIMMHK
jgi:tetratricopeptide (TPR) repeat protein